MVLSQVGYMNRVVVHPGRENLIDHLALINVFLNRSSAQVSGARAVCACDVVMVTSKLHRNGSRRAGTITPSTDLFPGQPPRCLRLLIPVLHPHHAVYRSPPARPMQLPVLALHDHAGPNRSLFFSCSSAGTHSEARWLVGVPEMRPRVLVT